LGSIKEAMMANAKRRLSRLRLIAGLTGSIACSSWALAQQPIIPQPSLELTNRASDPSTRLQVYPVPSDLVGALGARLQVQYHQQPEVRITTDPKTGQLMVMAPEFIHQQISAQLQQATAGLQSNDRGLNVGSNQQHTYRLTTLNWREVEDAIKKLMGSRATLSSERNGELTVFRISNNSGMYDVLQVDRKQNHVNVLGGGTVAGWMQVLQSLDAGQADKSKATQVVPLAPAEPRRVRKAFQLVKATLPQDQTTANVQLGQEEGDPNDPAMAIIDTKSSESGLFGDVQIEFIDELDLMVIRGSKRDVERTREVIEKIKKQAIETQPAIEVLHLQHANSQAVASLVTSLYEAIYQNRQGPVSITALVQPNALLLIGREEVVKSVHDLVDKLDVPLDPSNQLKVVRLLHASAVDAETTIKNFFDATPSGAGTTGGNNNQQNNGLGTRVKVLADFRTNSLILQGSPREIAEVEKLIGQIDVEGTPTTNEVRIFGLKNTVAADLRTVIQNVIDGSGGGTTGAGGAPAGGNTSSGQATPPSGKLTIVSRNAAIESGILAGVVVTSDPATNSLVVRAPSKSMQLIDELIRQLDRLPDAEARIKVFPIKNGDATSLATLLQQLFGLPVTAGQNTNGGLFGLGAANQLQALTTGGEGSLVQLRISVDTRTNSIIVSGGANDLEVIEVLLLRLDLDSVQTRRTEIVWLRNANAPDVANALNTFLQAQRNATTTQLIQGGLITAFEQVDREVFVVAEQFTNSLILSATPRYFSSMMEVIEGLDRRPPLVAIQVLIAQITLSDQFDFGTELGLQDSLLYDRGIASSGTLNSPGFNINNPQVGGSLATLTSQQAFGRPQQAAGQGLSTFAMGRSNSTLGYGGLVLSAASESVNVLVRALQDANRLQVLSRPQITTMDNRAASILVGQNVPRVQNSTVSVNGQTSSTVDVPVGLQLQIQPRVNQDGLIVMPLIVTNSSLGSIDNGIPVGFGANGEVIRSPIINATTASTTISAYSGQTVVFAGLINKQRSSLSRKIPFLGDIPILGAAFRFESESESRTELLVVLTPRIINSDEDYDMLTQVESSRMSWCLADILNIHGDVGLNGGNGLWGPARGPVIYPHMQPTAVIDGNQGIPVEQSVIEGNYQPAAGSTTTPTIPPANAGAANTPNPQFVPIQTQPVTSQTRVQTVGYPTSSSGVQPQAQTSQMNRSATTGPTNPTQR
jgi:general secretion pathway protein D